MQQDRSSSFREGWCIYYNVLLNLTHCGCSPLPHQDAEITLLAPALGLVGWLSYSEDSNLICGKYFHTHAHTQKNQAILGRTKGIVCTHHIKAASTFFFRTGVGFWRKSPSHQFSTHWLHFAELFCCSWTRFLLEKIKLESPPQKCSKCAPDLKAVIRHNDPADVWSFRQLWIIFTMGTFVAWDQIDLAWNKIPSLYASTASTFPLLLDWFSCLT